MVDLVNEELLAVLDVCHWLGDRTGKGRARATVYRWMRTGVRGVVLESCLVGGRRYTSVEALDRFVSGLSGRGPVAVPATAARSRELERIDDELDGIFGG